MASPQGTRPSLESAEFWKLRQKKTEQRQACEPRCSAVFRA